MQYDDPEEVANNKEVQGEAPQLVSASDIMSGAGYSSPDGQRIFLWFYGLYI